MSAHMSARLPACRLNRRYVATRLYQPLSIALHIGVGVRGGGGVEGVIALSAHASLGRGGRGYRYAQNEGLQNIASTASVTAGTFEIEVPVDKAIRYSGHADTETMAEHRE